MILYPDILEHNNTENPLIDASSIKGGALGVLTKTDRNNIPLAKRNLKMIVSFYDGTKNVTKRYDGADVLGVNWTEDNNWSDLGGSGTPTSSFVTDYDYDIVGLKNGVNTVYQLRFAYIPNSTKVYLNGLRCTLGASYDYIESGGSTAITFSVPLGNNEMITVDYIKS